MKSQDWMFAQLIAVLIYWSSRRTKGGWNVIISRSTKAHHHYDDDEYMYLI